MRFERLAKVGEKGGRSGWGNHRRSLVEAVMYRFKTIFGGTLKNRTLEDRKTEARLRRKLLNKLSTCGVLKSDPRGIVASKTLCAAAAAW